jgi:hypothetical protein
MGGYVYAYDDKIERVAAGVEGVFEKWEGGWVCPLRGATEGIWVMDGYAI